MRRRQAQGRDRWDNRRDDGGFPRDGAIVCRGAGRVVEATVGFRRCTSLLIHFPRMEYDTVMSRLNIRASPLPATQRIHLSSHLMRQRFEGIDGRRRLVTTLKCQPVVGGCDELAGTIADVGALRDVRSGEALICEGDVDNSIYFILSGSFDIKVRGRCVNERHAGVHVGEIAAIDPTQRRSATVIAREDSVVFELTESQLAKIANERPPMWRFFAIESNRRLVQRNKFLNPANQEIRVFIASSVEGLAIAQEIQSGLSHANFVPVLWTDKVFNPSNYVFDDLVAQLDKSDFAVVVATADDMTRARGQDHQSPRDNIVFELGLCMGILGRQRTLLVHQRGVPIKLPSDINGLTAIEFRGYIEQVPPMLGPTCTEINRIVRSLGAR